MTIDESTSATTAGPGDTLAWAVRHNDETVLTQSAPVAEAWRKAGLDVIALAPRDESAKASRECLHQIAEPSRECLQQSAAPAQGTTWPKTPADVRDFMHGNFQVAKFSREDQEPDEDDWYTLSAHDFLEAVNWWADFPHVPRAALQAAPPAPAAVAVPAVPTAQMLAMAKGYGLSERALRGIYAAFLAATPAQEHATQLAGQAQDKP